MTIIIGIKLPQRTETAPSFQNILSKFGCNIKTRIGLHDINETYCAQDGIILLEVIGKPELIESMLKELNLIEGISCKMMTL